ncbi:unnamed protein product [Sphenostylis stenocarpa]|uniref:BZIP domain-containing protein n=1 Tax=Sphenostylis stenocarpa TaxID=92480 RepID=A0AA86V946_9FABA|nr:unnamed protein product [Sphenostylis stenocarpa]
MVPCQKSGVLMKCRSRLKDLLALIKAHACITTRNDCLDSSYTDLTHADASTNLKMEKNQRGGGTQDSSIMKSVDQRVRSKGRNDIVTRRLKNRERQRRYRARKRLEAEIKKSIVVEETPTVKVEQPPNGNHNNNCMARIYCKRDWKKDARRAHVLKQKQMNGSVDPPTITSIPEVSCLTIGNKSETVPEKESQSGSSSVGKTETPRVVLSRRDWKAEARRKKN